MGNFKDKLIQKGFELVRRDLEKRRERATQNIHEKYLNKSELNDTLDSLISDIDAGMSKRDKLTFQIKELSNNLLAKERRVEASFDEYIVLNKELEGQRVQRNSLEFKIKKLSEKELSLNNEAREYKENIENLNSEVIEYSKRVEELESEIKNISNDLTLKEGSFEKLSNEAEQLSEEYATKTELLDSKRGLLNEVLQKIELSNTRKEDLSLKISNINNEISALRKDLDLNQDELSRTLEEISHYQATFSNCELDLSKLEVEKSKLLSKISDLKQSQIRIDALVNESLNKKRDVEKEVLILDSKKNDLDEKLLRSKKQYDKLKVKEGLEEELLSEKAHGVEELERELKDSQGSVNTLEKRIESLSRDINESKKSKRALKEDISYMERNLINLKKEIEVLEIETSSENKGLKRAEDEKFYYLEKLEKETLYKECLDEQVANVRRKIDQAKEEILELRDDLKSQEEILNNKKIERKNLLNELGEQLQLRSGLKNVISALDSRIEQKEVVLKRSLKELNEVKTSVEELHREVDAREDSILELDVKINKNKNIRLNFQENIDDLYFQVEGKELEIRERKIQLAHEEEKTLEVESKRDQARDLLARRRDSHERVSKSLSLTREENERLAKEVRELDLETYSLYEKLKSERLYLLSLKERESVEMMKVEKLSIRKRAVMKKVAQTSKEINETHEELDKYKANYSHEDNLLEELEEKYANLQMSLVHLRKNREDIEKEIASCKLKKSDMLSKIEELEKRADSRSSDQTREGEEELLSLRQEVASLSESYATKRIIFNEEVSKRNSLDNQLKMLRAKRDKLSLDMIEIDSKLDQKTSENESKREELLNLSEEIYQVKENIQFKNESTKKGKRLVIKRPTRDV